MDVVASATVTSGDLVKVGSKIVVAMGNALSGETFVGATCGVFVVPKEAGAVTQGTALYFKASTKTVTTSATGNTLAGYAFSSAESGDATVDMFLVDNTNAGTIGAVIADNVAAVAVADATDLTTAEALANNNKVKINAILTALKAAGIMTADV